MPLADENRHGPTDVACELDSRRANLTSALGLIESEQSASRGSCFVAGPAARSLLLLWYSADPEQKLPVAVAGYIETAGAVGRPRIQGYLRARRLNENDLRLVMAGAVWDDPSQCGSMTAWSDIDEPVLRWLLKQDSTWFASWNLQLTLRPEPEPEPDFGPGLDSRQIDEALQRLAGDGLIHGERLESVGYASWSRLRVRAQGLIALGEWPDIDAVTSFAGIQALVAALAEDADDPEDKSALKRTVGVMGQLGEGVTEGTLASVLEDAAKEL
jgi:hypothetical protein